MDHDQPAPEVMDVERVLRDDGRLLLLFTWGADAGSQDPAVVDGTA